VGLKSLKSLNLTNVYHNNNNNNKNNKVKSKPLELYELAGKKFEDNFPSPLEIGRIVTSFCEQNLVM
jgi:hypothetical protein